MFLTIPSVNSLRDYMNQLRDGIVFRKYYHIKSDLYKFLDCECPQVFDTLSNENIRTFIGFYFKLKRQYFECEIFEKYKHHDVTLDGNFMTSIILGSNLILLKNMIRLLKKIIPSKEWLLLLGMAIHQLKIPLNLILVQGVECINISGTLIWIESFLQRGNSCE